ncbi:CRISPR-associated endonuclease Cas2 [Lebetimonas sp. JH292]|uniref:CRISPR-associated endonuclease Cas2 n=1 Tax=Lebetimonas sp. JH292 TaxID=990068 RepID=UPI000463E5EA|nr:CRISPR-associated endonuclease Cas2 [Lebetimonas sp. JH292]
MKKDYKINYAFLMYDIADEESEAGKRRVNKVFKICKKYLNHHQKSVFRGEITPSNLIKLQKELKNAIDENLDFITVIKLKNKESFLEDTIGKKGNGLFI